MISTENVGPADWRLWRTLRLAALGEAPHAFGSTLADWSGAGDTEPRWRDRLAGSPLSVVARYDGEPAGMVAGFLGADGPELISMWVDPAFRGRGVGDALVERVIRWSGQRPLRLAVKHGNEAAISLYARHGFVADGPNPEDPGELMMVRSPSR